MLLYVVSVVSTKLGGMKMEQRNIFQLQRLTSWLVLILSKGFNVKDRLVSYQPQIKKNGAQMHSLGASTDAMTKEFPTPSLKPT